MSVKFENNFAKVKQELEKQKEQALEAVGMFVEGEAIVRCPVKTGNLRGSITHKVDLKNERVIIGTPVEYAPNVEYGTSTQKKQPFLRPAIDKNVAKIQAIIKGVLGKNE